MLVNNVQRMHTTGPKSQLSTWRNILRNLEFSKPRTSPLAWMMSRTEPSLWNPGPPCTHAMHYIRHVYWRGMLTRRLRSNWQCK